MEFSRIIISPVDIHEVRGIIDISSVTHQWQFRTLSDQKTMATKI